MNRSALRLNGRTWFSQRCPGRPRRSNTNRNSKLHARSCASKEREINSTPSESSSLTTFRKLRVLVASWSNEQQRRLKTCRAAHESMGIHRGFAQAACRWEMADIDDDRPQFIVAQNAFGTGHARRRDPVVEDPLQLAICVLLNLRRCERWDRGRHVPCERNPGVLTVEAMTRSTIVRKSLFPVSARLRIVRQGILLVNVPNEDVVLGKGHGAGFGSARRICLAAGQGAKRDRESK